MSQSIFPTVQKMLGKVCAKKTLSIEEKLLSDKKMKKSGDEKAAAILAKKQDKNRHQSCLCNGSSEDRLMLHKLDKQANNVLWESQKYPSKKNRIVVVDGTELEFSSEFTIKDMAAFVARRGQRRHGIHVREGKLLTELLKQYTVRKQLISMSLL